MKVRGVCSPEFENLKKIFQEYFDEQKELGANFSIVKNGNVLVNIFGGKKNNENSWDENTIVNTFSLSKGIYASCVAKLIEQNELDIEKKVSFYWPEFKKNKNEIRVKDILSHKSGLYRFKERITNEDLLDFDKIIKILEKQQPDHRPGTKTFYHAKTHGYLIDKLIRKITTLSLKEYFKTNFSNKFKLNFHFGLCENDFANVSDLKEVSDSSQKFDRNELDAFNNPLHDLNFYNSKEWRLAGIPSMGGHGSALSVATLYDILANDLKTEKKKIISRENFKKILKQSNYEIDGTLKLPIKWTYSGYILRGGWMFGENKEAFGHNGWGGSLGFGDPIKGIGIAYITKKINSSMSADNRAVNLIRKTYEILNKI